MRVRGGAGTRRGTERAYLSRRASERESEAAILRRSGCSVEVEDLSPGQVELDGSPAGLMRVVSLGRAGRGRGESSRLKWGWRRCTGLWSKRQGAGAGRSRSRPPQRARATIPRAAAGPGASRRRGGGMSRDGRKAPARLRSEDV
eukprot:scaffold56733_cov57-Phaeocystis_antarctica.AAC.2